VGHGRLTASAGAAAQSTAGEEDVGKTPDSGGGGRRPAEEEVEGSCGVSSFPLKIYPGFSLLI